MNNHSKQEALFAEHGYTDFKWIEPEISLFPNGYV